MIPTDVVPAEVPVNAILLKKKREGSITRVIVSLGVLPIEEQTLCID